MYPLCISPALLNAIQFTVKLREEYHVQPLVLTVAYYLWFDVTEIRLVVE